MTMFKIAAAVAALTLSGVASAATADCCARQEACCDQGSSCCDDAATAHHQNHAVTAH